MMPWLLWCWGLACLLAGSHVTRGQSFLIRNVHLGKCIQTAHERVSLAECDLHSPAQHWTWDSSEKHIVNPKTNRCLGIEKKQDFAVVKVALCGDKDWQRWACTKRDHVMLHGHGLHLNTKRGTNKIFMSQEKNKFSKWRTLTDEPICSGNTTDRLWTDRLKVVEVTETPVSLYETDIVSTFEETSTWSSNSWTAIHTSTLLPDFNGTALAHNSQDLDGEDGTNWKLCMLILSPLAFFIGLLVLLMNIHCNKKRKDLCALKSYPETWLGANSAEEHAPLSLKPGSGQRTGLAAHAPSLRHGEILIEWKDGTITPLFHSSSYQTD